MGTLPYTEMNFDSLLLIFSVKARKSGAGPSVTKAYNKDGGYLVTLRKERKLYNGVCCLVHGEGSP